jgi:uncharacterized repeat protein (TIGR01451 family)
MKTSSRNSATIFLSIVLLVVTCLPVWAKPLLAISIGATKEITVVKNGVKSTKLVPTQTTAPGEVLHYTLTFVNKGDEPAVDAVIDNPIPKGVTYVANSASGAGSEITFSTDNGKTYAQPVKLTYELNKAGKVVKRSATPEDYTHIRWTIKEVPAGRSGTLSFTVKVK